MLVSIGSDEDVSMLAIPGLEPFELFHVDHEDVTDPRRCLYRRGRDVWRRIRGFYTETLPRTYRGAWPYVVTAAALLFGPAIVSFFITLSAAGLTGLLAALAVVLLAVPLKVTCREDCKGLCPHCGKNLNQEKCSCAVTLEEPRWAALKEIRGKLAH